MASNQPWASAKDHHSLKTEGHKKENHANNDQGLEFPITGQSSIYSLTIDEIQNPICDPGRTFGSMSTDEFLSSICFGNEGTHPPTTAETASIAAFSTPATKQPSLQQQDSLSIPASVSWQTMDEVWDEMPDEQSLPHPQHSGNAGSSSRQHTIGEISLEDFLVNVGAVREEKPPPPSMGQGGSLMSPMLLDSPMVGQLDMDLRSLNGGKEMDKARVGRKRRAVLDGPAKIERLQKRMIKNRESAARSRARKLAYTMELEVEVDRLKEENARLREEKWQVMQTIVELMDKRARENAVKAHKTHRRCISFSASS